MSKSKVTFTDVTLRDGSHGLGHQLEASNIASYARAAEQAGIPIVEVGHGNGLGASSALIGFSKISDRLMLSAARENLKNSQLGVHSIPGISTVSRDLSMAIDVGVDIFRIATHCTEADTSRKHIEFIRARGAIAYGVLMMSHMAQATKLVQEAKLMESYGAQALIIMDSAGAYLPEDVTERIKVLVNELNIPVGFHAHNNLGMGIANSLAAIKAGALMLDGCARGLGAGAGNAQIEVLVPVIHKYGFETGIDPMDLWDAADIAEKDFAGAGPTISSLSVVSGLSGVFSGFVKPVCRAAEEFNVDPKQIFIELGKRKVVAGQENIIIEIAQDLSQMDSTL